ncbi:MAG: succinate dehydrogenase, cytochrome b556 subunit [Betaproteobacteria bacterium TMED156]|nr:MAG: succinate dehydrogenase, cytochrome b556 subunit [Betaproteobacteria bacterium TMED156]
MTVNLTENKVKRKQYRNIRIDQILTYRLPAAGIMSILHRISGAGLFLVLPLLIYLLQLSLHSKNDFQNIPILMSNPIIFLIISGVIWAIIHHFFAGIRHLVLDLHIGLSNKSASGWGIIIISGSLTLSAISWLGLFEMVFK